MTKIILDTNFLLIPGQFKVDIFSEFSKLFGNLDLFIVSQTKIELRNLHNKKMKNKDAVVLAMELLDDAGVKEIRTDGPNADVGIMKLADPSFYVATQDIKLRKKLLARGIPVIIMRQKKYLKIIRP